MNKLELLEKFDKEHNRTYTVDDLAELIVEAYNLGEFDVTERVRKLKDRIDDMPVETFGKYWLLDELEAALDGEQ